MRIGVFASDERMECLLNLLKSKGEVIRIDENDSMTILKGIASTLDVLVFPPWGVEESGFVRMKQRGIYVMEMLEHLNPGCLIFAGQKSEILQKLNHSVSYWLENHDVIYKNAQLTAQGVLKKILHLTQCAFHELKVDVIGSGCCAQACAELFDKLDISCRYVTRSPQNFILQRPCVSLKQWVSENPYDVIVNTAPACYVNSKVIDRWKNRKLVIDIASGFPFVDSKCTSHPSLNLMKMGGIPAKTAPFAAAVIIYDSIIEELMQ